MNLDVVDLGRDEQIPSPRLDDQPPPGGDDVVATVLHHVLRERPRARIVLHPVEDDGRLALIEFDALDLGQQAEQLTDVVAVVLEGLDDTLRRMGEVDEDVAAVLSLGEPPGQMCLPRAGRAPQEGRRLAAMFLPAQELAVCLPLQLQ
ncbi:MAG: hypothetical protein Q4Q58_06320 [Thermoplasmata archaeon]|nr:hypothetical protein [Thermoplasmata archaeon]